MPKPQRPWVRFYRLGLLITLAWLIFQKSSSTPAPTTADFRDFFPEAASLDGEKVLDFGGKTLGFFLATSPTTDHLKGYSGPSNVALILDPQGRLTQATLLSSADTHDHVQAVVDDPDFWKAHLGLTLGAPGNPKVDAVSGSTLTSTAISRSIIERLGGQTTSRLFPTDILLAEIPGAHSLEDHPSWPGVKSLRDSSQNLIGYALRTAPSQEYLPGYQGPSDVLIILDPSAQKISRLRFRKSFDNEEYYERILDHPEFLQLFDGLTLDEAIAPKVGDFGFEGVSGATYTSYAIIEGVQRRLKQFQADKNPTPKPFPWRNLALLTLTLGGLLFSFTKLRGSPIARLLWQITVVILLGLVFGDLLSQALFLGWAQHGLPLANSWGLVFLAAASLLIPWSTGHQIYCHQICPHGFLQRWLAKLPFKPLKIPPRLHRLLSHFPFLLLLFLIGSLVLGASLNLAAFEAFDAWLWQAAGLATILIAVLGLLASLFSPLAYCKYGCPTGALFKYLARLNSRASLDYRDLLASLLTLTAFLL